MTINHQKSSKNNKIIKKDLKKDPQKLNMPCFKDKNIKSSNKTKNKKIKIKKSIKKLLERKPY